MLWIKALKYLRLKMQAFGDSCGTPSTLHFAISIFFIFIFVIEEWLEAFYFFFLFHFD